MQGPLQDGEWIFLLDGRGRRHLKPLRAGHRIVIRGTVVKSDDLIGKPEGTSTPEGGQERFVAMRPGYAELATVIDRPAEPIFAKDAGHIIIRADIGAGDRVLEVGVGGGTLSMALLRAIGPDGELYSYELREDLAVSARRAAERYAKLRGRAPGEPIDNWTITVRDAREGFDQTGFDAAVVDMPDPAEIIDQLAAALRPGAAIVSYVPTVFQVKSFRDALAGDARFTMVETLEIMERPWHVEDRSMRPDHRMVAHTGFLTFARRTAAGSAEK